MLERLGGVDVASPSCVAVSLLPVVARSHDRDTGTTEGLRWSKETCGRGSGQVGRPAHNLSHEIGLQPVSHFHVGSFGGNDDLPRCLDLTVEVGRFVGQGRRESLFLAGQLQV